MSTIDTDRDCPVCLGHGIPTWNKFTGHVCDRCYGTGRRWRNGSSVTADDFTVESGEGRERGATETWLECPLTLCRWTHHFFGPYTGLWRLREIAEEHLREAHPSS